MLESYFGVIIGIALVTAVCIVSYFIIKAARTPDEPAKFLEQRTKKNPGSLPLDNRSISGKQPVQPLTQHSTKALGITTELRRNLLSKALGDEAKIGRLIDFERKENPNGSEAVLMKAAIDRWEQDSR